MVSLDNSGLLASGFTGSTIFDFSDQLSFWNIDHLPYDKLYYNTHADAWYDCYKDGAWIPEPGTPTTRKLEPGEGFRIVLSPVSGLTTWNYPKPYTQPPNN